MKFFINLGDYSEDLRIGIIKETADPDMIYYAKKSENPKERGAVALNPYASAAELDELSRDPDDYVKKMCSYERNNIGRDNRRHAYR